MNLDDPRHWPERIRERVRAGSCWIVDRVVVLPETPSTQDAAFEQCQGTPGLLLLAVRQTAGRGRLGRVWSQTAEHGLAATFVLDAASFDLSHLSLAAGLAAARSVDDRVTGMPEFGLRWPNDVVEPRPTPGGGRKIAGVLIEVRDKLALVGVGMNISQVAEDFPPAVRHAAVSLRQLGSDVSRIEVAQGLVQELHRALSLSPRILAQEWMKRDVLVNSTQEFSHNGARFTGVVESIDPANQIVLRTGPDSLVRLPAATTSLIRE